MKQFLLLAICGLILSGCGSDSGPAVNRGDSTTTVVAGTPVINYSIVRSLPHDTSLFTEGFLVHEGQLYESTGSPENIPQARSLIGTIDPASGKLNSKIEIDREIFGEGISFLKDRLYQLTYQKQVCFVYDAKTFKQVAEFKFANKEGWSLTTNDTALIMSDGTDQLTFVDPVTFKPIRKLSVTMNGAPRDSINELEYIKGYIYANIWYNNSIVKIDPSSGKVVGRLDLSSVVFDARNKYAEAEALNGIAYDRVADKVYITGKLWPGIYEINFSH